MVLACGDLDLAVSVNIRKIADGAPINQIKAVQSQMITKPSMQPLLKNESFTVATKNGTIVKITAITLVVFWNLLMISCPTSKRWQPLLRASRRNKVNGCSHEVTPTRIG